MEQMNGILTIREEHSCKTKSFPYYCFELLLILTFFPAIVSAQGDLLITPRRLVFEGSKRSIDLNLANTGKDTATYAISVVQIRMLEDGGFETITEPDPGQRFADRFIRFFPRTVTLGPNEAQTVKVQLIRTGELEPGEYRSHFYFRAIPKSAPLGEKEIPKDSSTISVRLTPIFGITIPVIIRIGPSDAKVSITDFSFDMINDSVPRVRLTFNRSGNMSLYGDLAVDYISPQGKTTRVGIANGVAVYTPNTTRRFQLNLINQPGIDYKSGTLHIIYSAPSDVKPEKYAEAELVLHQ
jgi:P pilus assembly chaperone PapD